ncbi:MAG TPA: aspartate kinase [Sedimentibacter sp.]|nr:aspartate kinase [Sedimentibacter sp.]HNZ82296.1 aspartate kinase [Sedimentibacter sp.]HOH69345.1 aspartate kinase [Sedimentibacter sp.]HQB63247.1 aspartate kinase [Sedimentibacter sp.]
MEIVVVKFGGTSLATQMERKEAIAHIASLKTAGKSIIAVVSAMGRKGSPYATDTLISLLGKGCNPAVLDLMMSCGEVISACVLTDSLVQQGIDAVALNSVQAGIFTNGIFGSADIFDIDTKRIKMELLEGKVVVVTGFQGMSVRNDITTLGRGGSDTSAVVIGGFLRAGSVHIFTDVPGIAVIDPRIVPEAKYMEYVDIKHMYALACWGAGVVHPRAIFEAQKYNLELFVRSTFDRGQGTVIMKDMEMRGPVGIGIIRGCSLYDAEQSDSLIISSVKKSVRLTSDSGYSLLTAVFSGYSRDEMSEAIGRLPVKSELYFNQSCAHILVETENVESSAYSLYNRLFGKGGHPLI